MAKKTSPGVLAGFPLAPVNRAGQKMACFEVFFVTVWKFYFFFEKGKLFVFFITDAYQIPLP